MSFRARPSRRTLARGAAVAVVGVLGVSLAAPSYAGPPGQWTTLGNTGVSTISQPGLARVGGTLTAAWTMEASNKDSILTRTVSAAGAAGAAQVAVGAWSTLTYDPKVVVTGSTRQVIFGGIQKAEAGEDYDGKRVYRATGTSSWALSPYTTFGESYLAYGGDGYGAVVLPGGVVLSAYDKNGVVYFSDSNGHNNHINARLGATDYHVSLARDAVSGAVWAVYFIYGPSSQPQEGGIWAQQVDADGTHILPVGAPIHLAQSVTNNQFGWNATDPGQDIAIAAPAGGGVYAAYPVGYPTATKVRVQRLGSTSGVTLNTPAEVKKVSLTSYGSKLWVSWNGPSGQVWAARSNAAKTGFGRLARIVTPSSADVYHLATDGATGRLDVVVTAQAYPKPVSILHTQLLAPLTVQLSAKKIKSAKGGKEKITVTDAGGAVAGATVTVAGKSKTTNAKGRVKFKIKKGTAKGKYKVAVKAANYANAKAKFKVK